MKKILLFLALVTFSFGQTPIKNRAIYTDTVRAWQQSGTTFPGAVNFTGLGNAAYKGNLHLGADNKLYKATDTSGSASNPTKLVLIDSLNNTGVTANIDFTGNTITAGTWAGTSIDTAYTNAVSKIVAGNTFLTATKNAKDYTLTLDTSKYATASVTGFLKYADFVTFNNSLDAGDTTTFRTASNVYYAPKIGSTNITTLGTITTGTWNGTSIDTAYTNAVSKLNNGLYATAATAGSKTYKVNVDTASIATTGTGQNITAEKIFTVAPKFTGLSTINQSANLHLGADNKLYFTNDTASSGGAMTKQAIIDSLASGTDVTPALNLIDIQNQANTSKYTVDSNGTRTSRMSFRRTAEIFDDFITGASSTTAFGNAGWTQTNSGTGAATGTTSTADTLSFGAAVSTTGTTNAGRTVVYMSDGLTLGNGNLYYEYRVRVPTMPTTGGAGENFWWEVGLGDNSGASMHADGVTFLVDSVGYGSTYFKTRTRANGTADTATYTGYTITAGTWVKLSAEIDGYTVSFYVNDVLARTVTTTQVPRGTARIASPNFRIVKTSLATARTLEVDYFYLQKFFTVER